jgi:hypothetical protein
MIGTIGDPSLESQRWRAHGAPVRKKAKRFAREERERLLGQIPKIWLRCRLRQQGLRLLYILVISGRAHPRFRHQGDPLCPLGFARAEFDLNLPFPGVDGSAGHGQLTSRMGAPGEKDSSGRGGVG